MKHRRKSKFHNEHGFTLIESTLVIVIIGLMAIIAVPKIISTDKHEVYIAGHQIVADMRYASGLAIANAENYTVTFAPDDGSSYTSYTIKDFGGTTVKSVNILGTVTCDNAGFTGHVITFTPLGSAEVTDDDGIIISLHVDDNYTQQIEIILATGRVWEHEPVLSE